MAGPNVGSVSVRVRPDSRSFAAELRRELSKIGDLKIKVTPELDDAKLRAQLAALSNKDLKIPAQVDLDQDNIGRELAGKKITIPAEVKIDQNQLGRALASRPIKIPARVDTDPMLGAFKVAARSVTSLFGDALSGIAGTGASAFSKLQGSGTTAFEGLSKSATGFSDTLASGLASAIPLLAKAAVLAPAIAIAGAGITAAWGAASTAIAAVPAAIGLIGAPIATLLLGMKGIKAAAKALAPEFNKLKASVSDTFQKQLTPVFNQLKGTLTALTPSIRAVATSMSGLAQQTANWITQQGGLQLIQTMFTNIATAIGQINLVPLLDGFTRLAGNQAALQVLTTTINQLGLEIQKIADNKLLDQAFAGLEGVLRSLTTAFGDLVTNGITLFANAAPGAQKAIDGIGAFFNKFDWKRLGTAVSNALTGVGDALKNIPQSTVDQITTSFEKLGQTLNSANFQNAVGVAAGWTSGVIGFLDGLIKKIAETILELQRLHDLLGGGPESPFAPGGGKSQVDSNKQFIADVRSGNAEAIKEMERMPPKTKAIYQQAIDIQNQSTATFQRNASTGAAGATNAFVGALAPIAPQTSGILSKMPAIATADLDPMANQIGLVAEKGVGLFGTGLGRLSPTMQEKLGILPGQADTALAPLATTSIPQATQAMVDAANAAIPGLGTAFQTGFTALGPLIDAAFGVLNTTNIPAALLAMGTAVTNGLTTVVGPAVTAGFIPVSTAFTTAFAALATTAVPAGFVSLGAAFTAGFTTLGAVIPALFLPVSTAFKTAFTALATVAVPAGMTLIAAAVTTGMTAVAQAFTAGFTQVNAAINAAMVSAAAAMTAGFVGVTAAVTKGMADATTAVTAGGVNMTTEVTTGGKNMVTAITTAMTDFNTAITKGMTDAVAAVKKGVADVIAALNAAAGPAKTAGENLGQAFVDGINSKVEAARAAGVALGKAAADGVNSQKGINSGSPSKKGIASGVNLGTSFVIGMNRMRSDARVAGANLGAIAADAMSSAFDSTFLALNGIADLDTRIRAEINSGSFDLSDSSSGDVILQIPVQVGSEPIETIVRRLSDADKEDLLLRLRAA